MLSFRSIFLAAAAFATVASAIPTPGVPGLPDVLGGLGSGSLVPAGAPAAPVRRDDDHPHHYEEGHGSPGDVFKKCHESIKPIVVELELACKGEGEGEHRRVNHHHVIGLLGEIIVVLKIALGELKLIIKAELFLEGVVCTIKELAGVICGLVILIVEVLYLVLEVVGFLDFELCGLIAIIGELLCELLGIVIILVEGLLVEIVVLITPHGHHCQFIHFDKILVLLKIVL